jgi:hypothetical protein
LGAAAVPVGRRETPREKSRAEGVVNYFCCNELLRITGGSAKLVFGLLGKTPAAVPNCGPGAPGGLTAMWLGLSECNFEENN